MKKYALILAILYGISFSSLYGQESKAKGNQIGINLFGLRYISENYVPHGYKLSPPNGIFFKHDTKNGSLRYFLSYNNSKYDVYTGPPTENDHLSETHQYSLWTFGAGFQKNMNYSKLRLYYGMDVFSDYSVYKVRLVGGIVGFNNTYKYNHLWIGLRPVVGLQYPFAKRFSVSVESAFSLAYRIINTDADYIKSVNRFQAYLNPVNTVLLSYHF